MDLSTETDRPFQRTTCACDQCVASCHRQPGPLIPGDIERIAAYLSISLEDAKLFFCASPGALVSDGRRIRGVGTICPKRRVRNGPCVFLTPDDRCSIHPVAPFGCSHFDLHMNKHEADERSLWAVQQQDGDAEYKALRDTLPLADDFKPPKWR